MRVIGGRYEGDTGLIVRVEENYIVLLSNLLMYEIKTLPKDLQLCNDVGPGVDSSGVENTEEEMKWIRIKGETQWNCLANSKGANRSEV